MVMYPPPPVSSTGKLAFGAKGRPQSPGKPRIPPNAEVEYDLKVVALPGREEELIAGTIEDYAPVQ